MVSLGIRRGIMRRSKTYNIPLPPLPWKRPGHNKWTGAVFNPQHQERIAWGLYMRREHQDEPLFQGPLLIDIIFFVRTPKEKPWLEGCFHDTIPDNDNFEKHLLDSMKNVLVKDDRIFAKCNKVKVYRKIPGCTFRVTELGKTTKWWEVADGWFKTQVPGFENP